MHREGYFFTKSHFLTFSPRITPTRGTPKCQALVGARCPHAAPKPIPCPHPPNVGQNPLPPPRCPLCHQRLSSATSTPAAGHPECLSHRQRRRSPSRQHLPITPAFSKCFSQGWRRKNKSGWKIVAEPSRPARQPRCRVPARRGSRILCLLCTQDELRFLELYLGDIY